MLYEFMAISERCPYDVIIVKAIVFIVSLYLFYCYIVLYYIVMKIDKILI